MKISKTSEIDRSRAFSIFKIFGEANVIKDNPNRVIFFVGTTYKKISDIVKLSKKFPIEVLLSKKMRSGVLRFVPLPVPTKFIIKVNNSSYIADIASELDLFLLIGIYIIDAKLSSEFVIAAQSNSLLKTLLESDNSSIAYVVNFDAQESKTGVMEYWTYDSTLDSHLLLYI